MVLNSSLASSAISLFRGFVVPKHRADASCEVGDAASCLIMQAPKHLSHLKVNPQTVSQVWLQTRQTTGAYSLVVNLVIYNFKSFSSTNQANKGL